MNRTQELREEADTFEMVAAFLFATAERKRRIADEMERIDAAGVRMGGGDTNPRSIAPLSAKGGSA